MFSMTLAFNVYFFGSYLFVLGLPRLETWDSFKCLNNLLFSSGTRVS